MSNLILRNVPPRKDYSEYWELQVVLVRILQSAGIKVGVKDRLPLFRLWNIVDSRMTGAKKKNIQNLLRGLVYMRTQGIEPAHKGGKYL